MLSINPGTTLNSRGMLSVDTQDASTIIWLLCWRRPLWPFRMNFGKLLYILIHGTEQTIDCISYEDRTAFML